MRRRFEETFSKYIMRYVIYKRQNTTVVIEKEKHEIVSENWKIFKNRKYIYITKFKLLIALAFMSRFIMTFQR